MASAQVERDQIPKAEEQQESTFEKMGENVKDKMGQLNLGKDNEPTARSGEKSEVGSPIEEAQQALKEKYDHAKEAMAQERSTEDAQKASEKSGLDDAKEMLRDEYDSAKKSVTRNDGTPEGVEAKDLGDSKTKGGELSQSAQKKIEEPQQGAADESMAKLGQAKDTVGSQFDHTKASDKSGLDDAKEMLRDEYDSAKKSVTRNDQTPEGVEAKNKGGELAQSAQKKIEEPQQGAADESMAKLGQAKETVGQKFEEAKDKVGQAKESIGQKLEEAKEGNTDESTAKSMDSTKGQLQEKLDQTAGSADELGKQTGSHIDAKTEETKGAFGKISDALKQAFTGSSSPQA